MGQKAERDKKKKKKMTETITELSRRTAEPEEIVKWNPMTALGFQTGWGRRHRTFLASLQGASSRMNSSRSSSR